MKLILAIAILTTGSLSFARDGYDSGPDLVQAAQVELIKTLKGFQDLLIRLTPERRLPQDFTLDAVKECEIQERNLEDTHRAIKRVRELPAREQYIKLQESYDKIAKDIRRFCPQTVPDFLLNHYWNKEFKIRN